jgi:hypothetical protein
MGELPAERWRELKVGDRVRIIRLPSGVNAPGYTFHRETRQLYLRLIARGRAVRIREVDGSSVPWIHVRFPMVRGGWEYHYLALNDDSWVRVASRQSSRQAMSCSTNRPSRTKRISTSSARRSKS